MSCWKSMCAVTFVVAGVVCGALAGLAEIIEVSPSIQVTSDAHYERGSSVLRDTGGNYWLFYGRSEDAAGLNYGNGNPDNSHYSVYFKRAAAIEELPLAAAQPVGMMPSTVDKIYQGQTSCVEYGEKIWMFAVDSGDAGGQVKAWTTSDDGVTWTVADVLPAGTDPFEGTHLWATVHDSAIYLAVNRGGDIDLTTYTTAGGWTALTEIVDHEGLPRFFVDAGSLYFYYCSWGLPAYYIYEYGEGPTWTLVATVTGTADDDCDPILGKVDGTYVLAFAPWNAVTSRQYLKYWTSTTIEGFDGRDQTTAIVMTNGSYGGTNWVDMWPAVLMDVGELFIFYGSEATGTNRGTGNIRMLEVDWDLANDHYCYVQNAIDAGGAGDTVNVTAGTYHENLAIDKEITLQGAGAAQTRIACEHTITASNVTIDGFTLDVAANEIGVTIDSEAAVIDGTQISNCVFNLGDPAIGIWLGGGTPTNRVSNVTISDDEFNGPLSMTANPWKIGGAFGAPLSCEVEGLVFERNTVDRCSTPVNIQEKDITNVSIHENTYTRTDGALYVWTEGNPTGVVSDFVFSGNTVDGTNTYGIAFGIGNGNLQAGNFGAGNYVRYNEFGAGIPGGYGLDAVTSNPAGYTLDATHNWWGNESGPSGQGPGTGAPVSANVDYDPWIQSEVAESKTETVTNGTVTTPSGGAAANVTGTATVTVAEYEGNPTGSGFGTADIGYIDVYVPDPSAATQIEIRLYFPAGTDTANLKMQWWDGTEWIECSNQGVDEVQNVLWAIVTAGSVPSLADLGGSIFGGGVSLPASVFWHEDFEYTDQATMEAAGWQFLNNTENLWHLADEAGVPAVAYANLSPFPSTDHAVWFGDPTSGSYALGASASPARASGSAGRGDRMRAMGAGGGYPYGELTSPEIDVSGQDTVLVRFDYYREVEEYWEGAYDQTYVQVRFRIGGNWEATWDTVWYYDSSLNALKTWIPAEVNGVPKYWEDWIPVDVPIGASGMQIQFVFDAVDNVANDFLGLLVDDLQVASAAPAGLAFKEGSLPEGVGGQPYSAALHVRGGQQPYAHRVESKPSWLTVAFAEDTFTLSGTPPAASNPPSSDTYPVCLIVTDQRGEDVGRCFNIIIEHSIDDTALWFDDFEGGTAWNTEGLWHRVADTGCPSPDPGYASPIHAYYYGVDATCNYVTGGKTDGALTSPPIAAVGGLIAGTEITIGWKFWREVEWYLNGSFDRTYVEISFDEGASWKQVWYEDCRDISEVEWTLVEASAYADGSLIAVPAGATELRIRFVFNSVDGVQNNYVGWLIDDVKVIQQTTGVDELVIDTICPLPNGQVDMAYGPVQLQAAGGVQPYTWGWTGNPPGLGLDAATGGIAGTPSTEGDYAPTVTVTDGAGNTAQKQFDCLHIDPAQICPCDLAFIDFANGLIDQETGANWTADGLWHVTAVGCVAGCAKINGAYAYFGQDASCDYETGAPVMGTLTSPAIAVDQCIEDIVVLFSHFREVEQFAQGSYDRTAVEICWDGGAWQGIWFRDGRDPSPDCEELAIGPIPVQGAQLEIRFNFRSIDNMWNQFFGWALDDIAVKNAACVAGPLVAPKGAAGTTRSTGRSAFQVVNVPNPVCDVNTTRFKVRGEAIEAIRIQIFSLNQDLVFEQEVAGDELIWHTDDDYGDFLANGVYLYRALVQTDGDWVATPFQKLVILR